MNENCEKLGCDNPAVYWPEFHAWYCNDCREKAVETREEFQRNNRVINSIDEVIARADAEGGVKYDESKLRWSLLPIDAVEQVVEVLEFGAKKYEPRNWEKGMDWSRMYDAALRHLTAWYLGEECAQDSGLSHLAHAACCLLFLEAYRLRQLGEDDRCVTK